MGRGDRRRGDFTHLRSNHHVRHAGLLIATIRKRKDRYQVEARKSGHERLTKSFKKLADEITTHIEDPTWRHMKAQGAKFGKYQLAVLEWWKSNLGARLGVPPNRKL